jgi:hypothetical protein
MSVYQAPTHLRNIMVCIISVHFLPIAQLPRTPFYN